VDDSDDITALFTKAVEHHNHGHLVEALTQYDELIRLYPNFAAAHSNRGVLLQSLKRLDEALQSCDRTIELKPDSAWAYSNRGSVLRDLQRFDEALSSYDRAIELKADFADAFSNRGNALRKLGRFDEALLSYNRAIELQPSDADGYNHKGNTLGELKRFDEALQSYNSAIELNPRSAWAYNNLGNALLKLERFDEALRSFNRAIEVKPDSAWAYNNRGNALSHLKRFDEALLSYNRAIELNPTYAHAHNNRGNTLRILERFDEAVLSYNRAIEHEPDYAAAFHNRGDALSDLKRLDEALLSYAQAVTLNPDIDFSFGALLFTKMLICDFSDLKQGLDTCLMELEQGKKVCAPFEMLAISGSAELQRKAAEIYVGAQHPSCTTLPTIRKHPIHKKVRLGYFSADYYNHPTMQLIAELFELHDKSRFELIAFSFGPDQIDEMHSRAVRAFDKFIDVRNQSDRNVALLSRSMEVDIAIDLKGFTLNHRAGIFSCRAAPIQVNYLGYPGTMGADYIDYIVADPTLIPEESKRHYREKIVYLPNSYQVNDRTRPISGSVLDRTELGLPSTGFVFCCFNNNFKITQSVFECWMRILTQVEGSVLWLLAGNEWAAKNLKSKALAAGVSGERIIFGQRLPLGDHLARLRSADLFLDTLPYNAHTTASETLWTGLPVLTCVGEAFESRVAASLLNAVGLPELVTTTLEAYEALAIDLARHPNKLAAIKQKLARNRLTTPLFDTKLFTKHLEAAYVAMYERFQADLEPTDIYVRSS
jgi:protein O-GlcNAc transferase